MQRHRIVGAARFVGLRVAHAIAVLALIALGRPASARAQTWTQLAPAGSPPSARGWHSPRSVYDPNTNRLITFGWNPSGASTGSNGVWVLTDANGLPAPNSGEWITLIADGAAGSPMARGGHSLVYDSANNRMIAFGGCGGACAPVLNDVWVLANANGFGGAPVWQQLSPAGTPPPPRTEHLAVYDQATNRMIVFGGQNGGGSNCGTYSDVWILSNANGLGGAAEWSQVVTAGGPATGRYGVTGDYDAATNTLIAFGGFGSIAGACSLSSAVWTLSNANGLGVGTPTWSMLTGEGAPGSPAGRGFGGTAYDALDNRLVTFGGYASGVTNQVWSLSNANGSVGTPIWRQETPLGGPPAARDSFASSFDALNRRLIVFAGEVVGGQLNDVWVLAPDTTAPVATPTQTPAANSAGWNSGDVTVAWNWADSGGAGLDTANCIATTTSAGEGSAIALSASCSDRAGNTGHATYTVRVDKTTPDVALVGGPPSGGVYYFGAVPGAPTCVASDDLSGVQSCVVAGYSPAVGVHAVTAVATDQAGNQRTTSLSYQVLPWTLSGFYQPIDMGAVWNTVKAGSTIPLKFEVFAGAVELTDTAMVIQPLRASETVCTGGAIDDIELIASGSTSLRYDAGSGQFVYNWQTPRKPGYCYVVSVVLADGVSVRSAQIKLK